MFDNLGIMIHTHLLEKCWNILAIHDMRGYPVYMVETISCNQLSLI